MKEGAGQGEENHPERPSPGMGGGELDDENEAGERPEGISGHIFRTSTGLMELVRSRRLHGNQVIHILLQFLILRGGVVKSYDSTLVGAKQVIRGQL